MPDLVGTIDPRTLGLILFGLLWLLIADFMVRIVRILWSIRGDPNAFYTRFTELPFQKVARALFRVVVAFAIFAWLIHAGWVK
jgi:hypothetical protein